MSSIARTWALDVTRHIPSFANICKRKHIILVAMFTAFVIKVCAKKTASIVLSYWIKSNNITSPYILSSKMIENIIVCQRSELPVGTIRTLIFSFIAKFSIPFSRAYRLIARLLGRTTIPTLSKDIITTLEYTLKYRNLFLQRELAYRNRCCFYTIRVISLWF